MPLGLGEDPEKIIESLLLAFLESNKYLIPLPHATRIVSLIIRGNQIMPPYTGTSQSKCYIKVIAILLSAPLRA